MPRRRQVHHVAQRLLERRLVDLAGAVQVDIDRQRLGDADGVGELDGAAVGELGRDHVLGEVARRIGRRAVDLGGVLAGEGAAAMRGGAAIGVDDDLAAGQAGVAIGSADDELAGRVDVPVAVVGDLQIAAAPRGYRARRPCGPSRNPSSSSRCWVDSTICVTLGRLAVDIADGDLALGVGAELADLALAGMARLRPAVSRILWL